MLHMLQTLPFVSPVLVPWVSVHAPIETDEVVESFACSCDEIADEEEYVDDGYCKQMMERELKDRKGHGRRIRR